MSWDVNDFPPVLGDRLPADHYHRKAANPVAVANLVATVRRLTAEGRSRWDGSRYVPTGVPVPLDEALMWATGINGPGHPSGLYEVVAAHFGGERPGP